MGTWSHLWFAEVRGCPPWYSIVGATVAVHQFFCILHFSLNLFQKRNGFGLKFKLISEEKWDWAFRREMGLGLSLNLFHKRNGIGLKFNNIINALSLQRYSIQNQTVKNGKYNMTNI